MISFEADVLSAILLGDATLSQRVANVSLHEQTVPIVVIKEIIRGRLDFSARTSIEESRPSM